MTPTTPERLTIDWSTLGTWVTVLVSIGVFIFTALWRKRPSVKVSVGYGAMIKPQTVEEAERYWCVTVVNDGPVPVQIEDIGFRLPGKLVLSIRPDWTDVPKMLNQGDKAEGRIPVSHVAKKGLGVYDLRAGFAKDSVGRIYLDRLGCWSTIKRFFWLRCAKPKLKPPVPHM